MIEYLASSELKDRAAALRRRAKACGSIWVAAEMRRVAEVYEERARAAEAIDLAGYSAISD